MNSNETDRLFFVKGVSMNPVLETGDLVELVPVARQDVQKGDILVHVNAEGRQIIHRVIGLSPLLTKGDNCIRADAPVPEASPLYRAVSCRHKGTQRSLTSGGTGLLQFYWNQCRKSAERVVTGVLSPFARKNPFRIPASRLTAAAFPDRTVYYAGKRPVGWMDSEGWHWLGWAQFYVQQPNTTTQI